MLKYDLSFIFKVFKAHLVNEKKKLLSPRSSERLKAKVIMEALD